MRCADVDANPVSRAWVALSALIVMMPLAPCRGDAMERIALDRLRATHEAVQLLAQDVQPVEFKSQYTDYRAVLHVHSHLSHDSRGTVEEIRQAAQEAGVQVVMFSEHPADHYDYFRDGHRGLEDGVLFIPGAEQGGLLSYPTTSVKGKPTDGPQGMADLVVQNNGLAFLSHLEERMDWDLDGLTGNEIYNTHADVKDEVRFVKALRNPAALLQISPGVRKYPQETFAALLDYPADYLKRWDELCQKAPQTGIAANDAHHNQGLRAVIEEDGTLRIEDALGETRAALDPEKAAFVKVLTAGRQPGETVFDLDLDPYARSFRHVSTHLLMNDLTESDVRETLQSGRAYVAFDWMADPTGFVFQAVDGDTVHPMGSEIELGKQLELRAATPLPGTFRLLRDGDEITSRRGRTLERTIDQPGIYRVEVWLNLPDGPQIWILSNPIYVRG